MIQTVDTLHLRMQQMRQAKYRFGFSTADWQQPDVKAFLVDRFAETKTTISVSDSSYYDFEIGAAAASSAADRFCIVFEKAAKQIEPVVTPVKQGIFVLQNPSTRANGINLRVAVAASDMYHLTVTNAAGATVHQSIIRLTEGVSTEMKLPAEKLSAGVYYINLTGTVAKYQAKIVLN